MALASLLLCVFLSYFIPALLPGDFVTAMYSSSHVVLSAEAEAELRRELDLDTGFFTYLSRLVRFDLGHSFSTDRPVTPLVLRALIWTLVLAGTAHILSAVAGFFLGVESAWRKGRPGDSSILAGMTFLEGIPELAWSILFLIVFALSLKWFPAGGGMIDYGTWSEKVASVLWSGALPLLSLFLSYMPGQYLMMRNSMITVLGEPYLTAARARGIPPVRVRYRHAARNALLPGITRLGLRLAFMVTGVIVVEAVFAYPGIGTLLYEAVEARDLPLIRGIFLFSSISVLAMVTFLDYVYRVADPRLKEGNG